MGFDSVELSFNLTREMVEEIRDSELVRIVSLHNFCPVPEGLNRKKVMPDYFSLASLDEGERRTAIKATKATIDNAARLGARAVVLHAGRIDMEDRTKDLIDLFERGLGGSESYKAIFTSMERERTTQGAPHLEKLFKSLEELARYSGEKGIYIGLENRFYYNEIPAFEELGDIFERFGDSNILYWHDIGHGHVWFNLAGINYMEYLQEYKERLLGFHIHDVIGAADHLAPFTGEINFSAFKGFITEGTLLVIEAHKKATADEIKKAKHRLEALLAA